MGLSFLRNWSLAHALRLTLRVQTGKVNQCSSTVRGAKLVSVDLLFISLSLFWGQAAHLKIPHKERELGAVELCSKSANPRPEMQRY
jgi:hypothetical protein